MLSLTAKALSDLGGAFSPERLALAGQMTLLGMGMIFAVLAILWGVLAIFKLIFAKPEKKKAKPAPAAPKAEPVVVPEPVVAPAVTDDAELIAVLTAAIAAYEASLGNEVAPGGFRVVSFRRANGGKAWNSK
ncbi:MAG: OadG family protein [Clostridia bacterium]|nr:OadG family protein [Clostridia bacterium]